jgi:hypothetical protein
MQNSQTLDTETTERFDGLRMVVLTPEAISNTWPELKKAIEIALPPVKEPTQGMNRMTYILESLLNGSLTAHAIYRPESDGIMPIGIVVTSIVSNIETGNDNLLILSLYAHTKYIEGDYADYFFGMMREYASGQHCKHIVMYSCSPKVINYVKSHGGSGDYQLLLMEV